MNKKIRSAVKAVSLVAALGLAVGCGKRESNKAAGALEEKAKEIAKEMKKDTDGLLTEEPAAESNGSYGSDFSDPMYDIGTEEDDISNAAAPSAVAEPQEEITEEDLERAIAALEEQLK